MVSTVKSEIDGGGRGRPNVADHRMDEMFRHAAVMKWAFFQVVAASLQEIRQVNQRGGVAAADMQEALFARLALERFTLKFFAPVHVDGNHHFGAIRAGVLLYALIAGRIVRGRIRAARAVWGVVVGHEITSRCFGV